MEYATKKTLLVIVIALSMSSISAQKKLALIVTIDNYSRHENEPLNNWTQAYAARDLNELWEIFHVQQQFDVVDTLTESHATKKGILKALDDLKDKTEKGSIVVFHFSGHGQQIYDVDDPANGLFIDEADGYDEALVAYDAQPKYNPNSYKGENHIRDEELSVKLDQIREKIGNTGSLLVLIDACHSGTITKDPTDRGIFRGSFLKIEPPGYKRAQFIEEKEFLMSHDQSPTLAHMVVISGTSQDQLNYLTHDEGGIIGALTFAFIKAMKNYREPVSYKVFFGWIKQTIENRHVNQIPLIEGADSLMVLGNTIIPTSGYITVKPIRANSDTIEIDRGSLDDIFRGMDFSVYSLNEFKYDTLKRLAKGRIISTDPFTAKAVLLSKKLPDTTAYKAIFDSKAFGDFTCAIAIKGNSPLLSKLEERLNTYKNLIIDDNNSDLIIKIAGIEPGGQKNLIVVRTNISDSRYDTIWKKTFSMESEIDSLQINNLFSIIKQFARAKYMRSFSLPPNDTTFNHVSIEIIPVIARDNFKTCNDNGTGFTNNYPLVQEKLSTDSILLNRVYVGIKAKKNKEQTEGYYGISIKVVNKDKIPVFLSVLEIQPDNIINVRVPHPLCENGRYSYADPNNFRIPERDSTTFWPKILAFGPTYGLTYLKVIVSDKPLNLFGLAATAKDPHMGKGIDDFLNEIINEDKSEGKYFTQKGILMGSTAPARSGNMKVVTYTFKVEE